MANLQAYRETMAALKKGVFKPIYLLHGEEPYYIDKVSKYIENHALEEHERDFNQYVFYGRDLDKDALLESLRRFPMMAQRQVVIIREAQDYSGRWADLEAYFNQPMESTILVIDMKYKSADAKTKWYKAIAKNGVVLQSKKHYDNELPDVISSFVRDMKYRIQPQAAQMMADYLGNDLEKIEMELGKISITIPLSKEIDTNDVHRLIGISKEYNVFEYINALSARDSVKSYRIARFLGQNEKNNPFLLIISNVFSHFSKVMMAQSLQTSDAQVVAKSLKLRHSFAARSIIQTGRAYSRPKVSEIISLLREFDARGKGVNASYHERPEDLLKELTYRILN